MLQMLGKVISHPSKPNKQNENQWLIGELKNYGTQKEKITSRGTRAQTRRRPHRH
jgi:hypothetical protein